MGSINGKALSKSKDWDPGCGEGDMTVVGVREEDGDG